jgi:RNA polymerase sigma-70 factor (ECF subfamily)
MDQLKNIEQLTDEQLVPLVLADRNNFVLITMRYKLKLFSYIKRLTNIRDEDAEDLLQDIFLKVYLNLNSFNQQMKFSSWIYAIARNQIISHYRKLHARPEGHAEVLDDQLAERFITDFNLPQKQDQQYAKEAVNEALYKLKSKHRDILILKYIEEKSYQEISDIIKKPVGTVGSLLSKAREELKKNFFTEKLE